MRLRKLQFGPLGHGHIRDSREWANDGAILNITTLDLCVRTSPFPNLDTDCALGPDTPAGLISPKPESRLSQDLTHVAPRVRASCAVFFRISSPSISALFPLVIDIAAIPLQKYAQTYSLAA
jgi:hypothetical protein